MRAVRLDSNRTEIERGKTWIGEKIIHVYHFGFVLAPKIERIANVSAITTANGYWGRVRTGHNPTGSRNLRNVRNVHLAHLASPGAKKGRAVATRVGAENKGPRATAHVRHGMKR